MAADHDDTTTEYNQLNEARYDDAIEAAADAVQDEVEQILADMDAEVTDDKDGHHLIVGILSDSTHFPHLQSYVAECLKQRLVDGTRTGTDND